MSRTVAVAVLILVAALIVLTCAVLGPGVSGAADPSPSPSASPSPDPTPTVIPAASSATVKWAKGWRAKARVARTKLAKVRRCFRSQPPLALVKLPARSAPEAAWQKAGRRLKHQTLDWRGKVKAGVARMRKPGGTSSGARWLPLARWVGWPEHTLSHLAYIIMRESSGRTTALNPSSLCSGLLQIHPCHGVARPFDPEVNLRAGLRLYRSSGWAPWAL